MVDVSRTDTPIPATPADGVVPTAHVDWPAIFVGAAMAAAISFVLNTFGSAIGLSVVSPFDQDGTGGLGLLIATALWILWVTVSSFMAGAYATGRLRRRAYDATPHESDIRDGIHGLAVWAVGVLVGALIFAAGVDTAVRTGAQALSGAGAAAGSAIVKADSPEIRNEINRLFMPASEADPAPGAVTLSGDEAPAGAATTRSQGGDEARARDSFTTILETQNDEDGLSDEDKSYMAEVLSRQTGLSDDEARARVDGFAETYAEMRTEAMEAAEVARKASIIGAFVLAATLLISAAGAWVAAGMGGRHRDEQTVFAFFARRN